MLFIKCCKHDDCDETNLLYHSVIMCFALLAQPEPRASLCVVPTA